MATSRLQKEQAVEGLRRELEGVPHAFLVDFQGLDVAGASDLRRQLRNDDASFRVVKNTVALLAFADQPLAGLSEAFVGQTAIAYTGGDVVRLAKVLRDFAKELETPKFKAGMVDGEPITFEQFEQLADLPPRKELIAKALYLMNYPVTGLVTALSAILRSSVIVLDQIRQKKEEAGESAPAPVEAATAEAGAAEQSPPAAVQGAPAAEEATPAAEPETAEEASPAGEPETAEEAAPAAEEAAPAAEEEAPAAEEEAPAAQPETVEEAAPAAEPAGEGNEDEDKS
jgi:large subunit ribosomal protein L10